MKLWWMARQRRRLVRRVTDAPLSKLLNTPLPERGTVFSQCEFVSLDLETTGLDAARANVISAGWVVIRGGRVDLDTCQSHLVRANSEVGESASVHGLTDTIVRSGLSADTVIEKIVEALAGRILVVHHAGLDKTMLDKMCRARFSCPLIVPVVDTMALELRRRQRRHHMANGDSVRLADLRSAYGLPYYQAHDCLVDAIATAELLLAMVAARDGANATRLTELVS